MSNATLCLSDGECPGTLVCFQDVSWSSSTGFCDCSSLFGFTGQDCSSLAREAKKSIVYSIVIIIVCCPFLFVVAQDMTVFWKLRKKPERLKSIANTLVTWVFSSLGLLAVMIYSLISIAVVSMPTNIKLQEINGVSQKIPSLSIPLFYFFTLTLVCIILAGTSIAIVWLKAFVNVRVQGVTRVRLKVFNVIALSARLFSGLFIVTSLFLLFRTNVVGEFIFGILSLLVLAIILLIAWSGLKKIIESFRESLQTDAHTVHEFLSTAEVIETQIVTDERFEPTMITISRTFFMIAFALLLTIVSTLTSFFLLRNWQEFSPPGGLAIPFVFRDLALLGVCLFLIGTYWYAHIMAFIPALSKPSFGPTNVNLGLSDYIALGISKIRNKWTQRELDSGGQRSAVSINLFTFRKKYLKQGNQGSVYDSWADSEVERNDV